MGLSSRKVSTEEDSLYLAITHTKVLISIHRKEYWTMLNLAQHFFGLFPCPDMYGEDESVVMMNSIRSKRGIDPLDQFGVHWGNNVARQRCYRLQVTV